MDNTNQVLAKWKEVVFSESTTANGDTTILPKQRNQLRREVLHSLKEDLEDMLSMELAEVVINGDNNIIIIAENEHEGSYCIQLEVKIKNLNYNVFEDLKE